ncbi:MAG: dTDP-4-dehydrorhamnose 3,5-epimerase family protein [Patescibacteria group bacterium]|nr:dTDP-4-dehydrorhamnose 3,5-epimerase family protein [Patescibacteria group bacterium]
MTDLYQPNKELESDEGVFETGIKGLWYFERKQRDDNRGFFAEIAHIDKIEKLIGQQFVIKQINYSRSLDKVVRGMHAENWKKLITVTCGLAFCALADIRPNSESFGKVVNFKLGEGGLAGSLLVEEGVANSFCVLAGPVDYVYFVDRLYKDRDPKGDVAISLFDADLKIDWPLKKEEMIISQRDKNSVSLRQRFPDKF